MIRVQDLNGIMAMMPTFTVPDGGELEEGLREVPG